MFHYFPSSPAPFSPGANLLQSVLLQSLPGAPVRTRLVRDAAHISAKTKSGPVNSLRNTQQSHANWLLHEKTICGYLLFALCRIVQDFMTADRDATGSPPISVSPCKSHGHQSGRVKLVALLLGKFPGFCLHFLCRRWFLVSCRDAWFVCRHARGLWQSFKRCAVKVLGFRWVPSTDTVPLQTLWQLGRVWGERRVYFSIAILQNCLTL